MMSKIPYLYLGVFVVCLISGASLGYSIPQEVESSEQRESRQLNVHTQREHFKDYLTSRDSSSSISSEQAARQKRSRIDSSPSDEISQDCDTLWRQWRHKFDTKCHAREKFGVQQECRLYINCPKADTTPILGCCPADMHFDYRLQQCVSRFVAVCQGHTEPVGMILPQDLKISRNLEYFYQAIRPKLFVLRSNERNRRAPRGRFLVVPVAIPYEDPSSQDNRVLPDRRETHTYSATDTVDAEVPSITEPFDTTGRKPDTLPFDTSAPSSHNEVDYDSHGYLDEIGPPVPLEKYTHPDYDDYLSESEILAETDKNTSNPASTPSVTPIEYETTEAITNSSIKPSTNPTVEEIQPIVRPWSTPNSTFFAAHEPKEQSTWHSVEIHAQVKPTASASILVPVTASDRGKRNANATTIKPHKNKSHQHHGKLKGKHNSNNGIGYLSPNLMNDDA